MDKATRTEDRESNRRFYVLDGFRGIAAIIVVLFHYLGPDNYAFLSNSYIAVDLFFVLSGFVIYHSYADRVRSGMKGGRFINLRFSRLAPTVAVGVFLGAGATLAHYAATGREVDMSRFLLAHAGHLLFIPDLVDYHVPQTGIYELFPSNGPLWSIFFEFVASVCFIWFARIPRKGLWLYSLLSFAVLLAGCYYVMLTTGRALSPGVGFSPATFYLGFPRVFGAFFAGMAIYALTQEGRQPIIHSSPLLQSSALTLAVYTLISAVLLFPDPLSGIYPFLAIIVFCPALIALGGILAPEARWLRASSDYLGQLSFPLYCVHEPVRVLVTTHFSNMSWSLQILLAFGLAMAFSAFVLLVFDWLRVRQNLSAILKPVTG